VALETAVVTHGLPREALERRPVAADDDWNQSAPANLELARLLDRTIRGEGAVPATIGVLRGVLHIGMDEAALTALAGAQRAIKGAARDLSWCLASGASAGLTVAGTLEACALPALEGRRITCFATGGIGGVHRGWARSADISADLAQLAHSRVCVVCAGPKAILDVAATMELLDTLGVPVVGFETSSMPRFICPPDERLQLTARLDAPASIASLCRARWTTLGQRGGVLVVQPVPSALAVDPELFEEALHAAEEAQRTHALRGAEVTPDLLASIARRTAGGSVEANIALLRANARLAAGIARALKEEAGAAAEHQPLT
jgi:pseudouridine-5'-phosphate glycosidase